MERTRTRKRQQVAPRDSLKLETEFVFAFVPGLRVKDSVEWCWSCVCQGIPVQRGELVSLVLHRNKLAAALLAAAQPTPAGCTLPPVLQVRRALRWVLDHPRSACRSFVTCMCTPEHLCACPLTGRAASCPWGLWPGPALSGSSQCPSPGCLQDSRMCQWCSQLEACAVYQKVSPSPSGRLRSITQPRSMPDMCGTRLWSGRSSSAVASEQGPVPTEPSGAALVTVEVQESR
jgi:hypothetical protein